MANDSQSAGTACSARHGRRDAGAAEPRPVQPTPSREYLLASLELEERVSSGLIMCIEKISGHFDTEGNLKGNGQWRMREIFSAVKGAEKVEEIACDDFDRIREAETQRERDGSQANT